MSGPAATNYACKCLNIRIQRVGTPTSPPDCIPENDFIPVFVGEEGIIVKHTQVTVRTRTQGRHIAGKTQCSRYTTITCLLCDLLVYRVHQTYPADIDGKEGPLLPTEDWVEREILKGSNGWIEVNNDCLIGESVDRAFASSNFSSAFSLLLPESRSLPTSIEPFFERTTSRSTPSPRTLTPSDFFSTLRPVFLPPPFTPSFPVFAHFASLASKESQSLREAATEYLNDQWQAKIAEIEQADAVLRRIVENIWKKFMDGVSLMQQHIHQEASKPGDHTTIANRESSPLTPIRDFSPISVLPATFSRSTPQFSALSASLATSTFHHPEQRVFSPTREVSKPPHSDSGNIVSDVVPSVDQQLCSPEGTNVLKYRRNLQETVDYAASFKYFVELEKEMALLRGRKLESSRAIEQDFSQQASMTEIDQVSIPHTSRSCAELDCSKQLSDVDEVFSRGQEKATFKAKRKVTFDVQPSVVTFRREILDTKKEGTQDQKEMLFDFEEVDEESSRETLNFSRPPLQSGEQLKSQIRQRRRTQSWSANLPESYAGLRPASLPPPSRIRPPRSQHGSDSSSSPMLLSYPKVPKDKGKQLTIRENSSCSQGFDTPEACSDFHSSPSHIPQGDGSTRPRYFGQQERIRGIIPEEWEDDPNDIDVAVDIKANITHDVNNVVGSLPIPIQSRNPPPLLSLASYQPETVCRRIADENARAGFDGNLRALPKDKKSSSPIRRAMYAKRDLLRCMDPGPSDFVALDQDEKNDVCEAGVIESQRESNDVGGRGRRQALKILQSQSEIPEAGMWRSLAS